MTPEVADIAAINAQHFDTVSMTSQDVRAKGLDRRSKDEGQWLLRRMRRLLGVTLPANGVVVEMGAGTGYAGQNIRLARPDCRVILTDIAPQAAARLGGLCCSADQLLVPDGSADLVIGRALLHHCPLGPAVIAEALRVLKPGGVAVFWGDPHPNAERLRAWKKRRSGNAQDVTPRYVRTVDELQQWCAGRPHRVRSTGWAANWLLAWAYAPLYRWPSLWAAFRPLVRVAAWLDDHGWTPRASQTEHWLMVQRP